ncbi:MAG: 23S rRNA (adenine(2503)-C(2))-methyltransferase RlmN [Anaerolineae bacterium]|jgi:23S rRNA (adenine2503-C2)-methyltransferase|nr:23S rRNA (adenine(2503)-C(2))-methyltransferase RlmN [Anaerolineae bacterium]MBT7070997.1 23S rRNA (adenine(2503)-C(2))-methyltransferase RlmN [Anaerolineae bacterium]MBT7325163.1 23S rRNA (adenine(2503)-C(2))-methyltransferase RlmN [Anaerolineae bacterium]
MNKQIYDFDFPELSARVNSWGVPKYRAQQVWDGLYKNLWLAPEEFTNLSKELRGKMGELVEFNVLKPVDYRESKDGETLKTLFELHDGQHIETVLMKYDTEGRQPRRTVCISTQVGCGMGCTFCATGQMGFKRQLSSGEIVAQVIYFARKLQDAGETLTNVVVMGMGEPLHNYAATMEAIDRLNNPDGFAFGARRFTISTVGLVPLIKRFADEKRQVNLAISLHAAEDELRSSMLPINEKYPISNLLEVCRYYVEQTHRRITFEWALIEGVNDTPEQAHILARRVKGLLCHVNAIPLNPTQGFNGKGTGSERAKIFKETLEQAGVTCTIRAHRGIDIQAGCGQLASREK